MDVERAFKKLLITDPFYGLFCLNLSKEITTRINTMAVTVEGLTCKLLINIDFWNSLTDDQQIALLLHELNHICFQHMLMRDSFTDKRIFNLAADCEVNSYIKNLPDNATTAKVLSEHFNISVQNGLGTKEYYKIIMDELEKQRQESQAQNPQNPCNGGKGGNSQQSQDDSKNSNGEDKNNEQKQSSSSPSQATSNQDSDDSEEKENQNQPSSSQEQEEDIDDTQNDNDVYPEEFDLKSYDDHSQWRDFDELSESAKQLVSKQIDDVFKHTAEQIERMNGTIPNNLKIVIDRLNEKREPIFNWKAYFRRILGTVYDINIKTTRRKPSKRYEGAAGIRHRKKVSILIAVDTSASVSKKELMEFFVEIDLIYKAKARVTIIQCDTRIHSIEEYDGKKIPEVCGRGATDFNPPVDYYAKHKKEYSALIYFTDGKCSLPRNNPSNIIWVITSNGRHQKYPGKAIYIPKIKKEQ